MLASLLLGVIFTSIACYAENANLFNIWNLLLVLVYGIASYVLLASININQMGAGEIIKILGSFLLVAVAFRLFLVIYSWNGLVFTVNWNMAIFFWILVSGMVMTKFMTKAA